jgi:hypothetical protein
VAESDTTEVPAATHDPSDFRTLIGVGETSFVSDPSPFRNTVSFASRLIGVEVATLKSDTPDTFGNLTAAAGFGATGSNAGTPSSVAADAGADTAPFGTGSGGTDSDLAPTADDGDA